jgi:ribosomal protein S12 methylthiotransferase accessory factor
LDGTRTETELVAALPSIAPGDLKSLLQALQEHGLLLHGLERNRTVLDATERRARLQTARAVLVGDARWVTHAAAPIRAAGVGKIAFGLEEFDAFDIAIGIFADRDVEAVRNFASIALTAGVPSLTCVVGGGEAVLGPFAIPSRTACWNCAHLRLRANAECNNSPNTHQDIERMERAIFDPHLTREVCDALCLDETGSPLVDHVLVLDGLSMRTSLHPVLAVPGCSVCGGPARAPRPLSDGVTDVSDDAAFDLALQALSWFVDDRTGIVNRVIVESPSETGLEMPVVATAIAAAAPVEAAPTRQMPVGWGKGNTAAAAVIGAVGEAIERYAGSMPDPARLVWSRPADLPGSVLHPRELALYRDDQFARADFPYVQFDSDVPHPWIAGEWVGTHDPVWLPAILVYLSLDVRREQAFCQGTSNGMSAGTNPSEAGLRAILELLERDAFITSWLCKRPGRPLQLDETLPPDLKAILSGAAALGAQVELVLLESVCDYPTAVCLGFGDGVNWPGVTLGLGTDPDARTAVRQAILEFGQTGPHLRMMMKTAAHLIPKRPSDVADMLDHARYYFPPDRARAFDHLRHGSEACAFADLPRCSERSLLACARALAESHVRVALADVTSADVARTSFVVVRAISPDLQPISFGYGLDRLPIPRLKALGIRASSDEIAPIW